MNNSFNTITRSEPSNSKLITANDSVSLFVKPTGEFGVRATGTPSIIIAGAIGICLGIGTGYWLYDQTKK